MEFVIPLVGFGFGLAVGRWWTIAAAAPFGGYVFFASPLEGNLPMVVAVMLSCLLACAIGSGVALRRLRARSG
jgi:hypothetical protein